MNGIESVFMFLFFLVLAGLRWCVDASWNAYLIGISVLMAGVLIAGAIAGGKR